MNSVIRLIYSPLHGCKSPGLQEPSLNTESLMKHKETFITKASGERHMFSEDKLRNSLLRSGASPQVIDAIMAEVIASLYDGITTAKIYGIAFRMLRQRRKGPAARYKLKNALMELGPTGFPFEQFIARVFQQLGFETQTGKLLEGKCVRHEVDVVANKGTEQQLIECKFHQQKGICCDVKIPLYIHSRFADIEARLSKTEEGKSWSFTGWVVTNTHFTKDATTYGLCAGLRLLGWDFPAKGSLRELVDQYDLHPLTCLTTLTRQEKQQLLEKRIVLCSELKDHEALLKNMIHGERLEKLKTECAGLASRK
jgi:hypothetical protein